MVKGIGLDFSLADGTPERLELDAVAATQLVPALSKRAGGTPTPAETAQYQVDMAHIVAVARLTGQASPDGVELASGVLPPLLGIQANGQYVKSVLAPYVDPPLPWPAASGTGAATDRAAALARTFHRAHAIDWCNRFRGGSPDRLDVDVLRANAAMAKQTGAPQEEIDARRAVCEEFAARHLRVGTGETSYDTSREPLCHFLADDPASTQYVYQPGGMSDDVPTLAAIYCGGLTVSVAPPTAVVPSGGTQQFTATVHGATDQHVTWTIVSGDETTDATIDDTGLFTAGAPGTVTVRATSVVATTAFAEATVTVVASSCGNSFSKELILGNHEQSQTLGSRQSSRRDRREPALGRRIQLGQLGKGRLPLDLLDRGRSGYAKRRQAVRLGDCRRRRRFGGGWDRTKRKQSRAARHGCDVRPIGAGHGVDRRDRGPR
jgi:hypothetical protein